MKLSPKITQFPGVVYYSCITCKSVNLTCNLGNIIYIDSMTISKDKIKILKNTHLEDTMSNLDKLLKEKNISQAELARKLGRDPATVNRWVKNSREVAWNNAEEVAKVLNCHPVELYNPKVTFNVSQYVGADLIVKKYPKDQVQEFPIYFEALTKETFGVHFNNPGLFLHGRIYLFNKSKIKMQQFDRNSLGQLCYFEPSAAIKTKFKNQCTPILGILEKDGLTKYKIINPLTQEPVNPHSKGITLDDISVCTPVKCEYYPETIINK